MKQQVYGDYNEDIELGTHSSAGGHEWTVGEAWAAQAKAPGVDGTSAIENDRIKLTLRF